MIFTIENHEENFEEIFVASVGFNIRPKKEHALIYDTTIDSSHAAKRFSDYYDDFIDREKSGDDFYDNDTPRYYKELEKIRYPGFQAMLESWPNLLAAIIKDALPSEFLGYCFKAKQEDYFHTKYTIITLEKILVSSKEIKVNGFAFRNPDRQ